MYEIDEKCQKCKNNGTAICNRCDMFYDEFDPIDKPPKTNADLIRSMTDEELARFLYIKTCEDGCPQFDIISGWLNWLKQKVEEGE